MSISESDRKEAKRRAENRLINLLLPPKNNREEFDSPNNQRYHETRKKLLKFLQEGQLDERLIEIEIEDEESKKNKKTFPSEILKKALYQNIIFSGKWINQSFKNYYYWHLLHPARKTKRERIKIKDALKRFFDEELAKLVEFRKIEEEEYYWEPISNEIIIAQTELLEFLKKKPELIYKITHRQFEELILEILIKFGFHAELTARTRDGGCDIIALSSDKLDIKTKYIIEAKHYSPPKKVSVGIVRQLNTVKLKESGHHGILVTSSYFTKDAITENKTYYGLYLQDYDKLVEWIYEAQKQ